MCINIFQFKASFQESLEELAKSTPDTSAERKYLEEQIKEMKAELKLKNDKIDKLEKIVYKKKEAVATQVRLRNNFLINASYPFVQTRRTQPAAARLVGRRVSPAKSLHNISISHVSTLQGE